MCNVGHEKPNMSSLLNYGNNNEVECVQYLTISSVLKGAHMSFSVMNIYTNYPLENTYNGLPLQISRTDADDINYNVICRHLPKIMPIFLK